MLEKLKTYFYLWSKMSYDFHKRKIIPYSLKFRTHIETILFENYTISFGNQKVPKCQPVTGHQMLFYSTLFFGR